MLTKDNLLFFCLGIFLMGILSLKYCGERESYSKRVLELQQRNDSLSEESKGLKNVVKSLESKKADLYTEEVKAKKEYKSLPKIDRLKKISEIDSEIVIKGDSGAYLPITAIDSINEIIIDNGFTHKQLNISDSIIQVQKSVITNDSLQIGNYKNIVTTQNKEISSGKKYKFITKVTSGLLVVVTFLYLIK